MKRNTRKKYILAGQLLLGISVGAIASVVFVNLWGSSSIGYAIVLALLAALLGGVIGDMIFKSKKSSR